MDIKIEARVYLDHKGQAVRSCAWAGWTEGAGAINPDEIVF